MKLNNFLALFRKKGLSLRPKLRLRDGGTFRLYTVVSDAPVGPWRDKVDHLGLVAEYLVGCARRRQAEASGRCV
jgi:hypothetical protein